MSRFFIAARALSCLCLASTSTAFLLLSFFLLSVFLSLFLSFFLFHAFFLSVFPSFFLSFCPSFFLSFCCFCLSGFLSVCRDTHVDFFDAYLVFFKGLSRGREVENGVEGAQVRAGSKAGPKR